MGSATRLTKQHRERFVRPGTSSEQPRLTLQTCSSRSPSAPSSSSS
jgi:hypothetical protein